MPIRQIGRMRCKPFRLVINGMRIICFHLIRFAWLSTFPSRGRLLSFQYMLKTHLKDLLDVLILEGIVALLSLAAHLDQILLSQDAELV